MIEDQSPPTEKPYRQLVGELMHVMNVSRPDIAYALSVFSRFSAAPRQFHWKQLETLVNYLAATHELGLKFTHANGNTPVAIGYSDADHATDPHDRISQMGYTITLNGTAIMWNSRKLASITQSSCESELMALNACTNNIKWFSMFISRLNIQVERPIMVLCDNMSTVLSASNPQAKTRLKHVEVRSMKLMEYLNSRLIQLQHVKTTQQTADIFTKPLTKISFETHRENMGITRRLGGSVK